ncbi:nak/nak-unclassified protein kinase [Pseudogymnoascus destructans 20631-21]|uniref:non-specific serine/threonine protein kinase n=1 Tax=Pseudogymnoascus destructans (strain ATCC MYA-4855 / 20631-21) TaxID=658429 RepID=L8GAE9_PSED2|nr:nak/nak-unclassified protein kinase [Pseudogymnoascus destructans 20631-21]
MVVGSYQPLYEPSDTQCRYLSLQLSLPSAAPTIRLISTATTCHTPLRYQWPLGQDQPLMELTHHMRRPFRKGPSLRAPRSLWGGHKVVIQKYFSEGGFAHVYLVKMPEPKDGTHIAVLKRVAVPDKDSLGNMRTEVETMKKLKGHRPIVKYYDSHASQLKGGGYEVFLLMEFCSGGGLIDFMNTRLQNRLTEPEILKIFSDVTEGVACMHYLKPPLLHRDLKVENVLITKTSSGERRYKLCDFGSTAPPRAAATTAAECRLIEEDVQKHTTLQYRSPEMVDVYRKLPIDEKSDIWALGVLLYKLCYYTTPFEEKGQLSILNASFKFPAFPVFSDRLKLMIATMLRENPDERPNVYQVLREACHLQGIEVPIKNIYAGGNDLHMKRNQSLPNPHTHASPAVGAAFSPPTQQKAAIPDVIPMRRGRPTTTPQAPAPKPTPSPMRVTSDDPFAALDAKSAPPTDELSSKFPSIDQFSLLHEKGSKFEFDSTSPTTSSKPKDLNQRVTEKLADNAFAASAPRTGAGPSSQARPSTSSMSKAQQIIFNTPELQATISPPSEEKVPTTYKPKSSYVSEGTMTSPSQPTDFQYKPAPIHRFPPSDQHRSVSLPRNRASIELEAPNRGLLSESPQPTAASRSWSSQLKAAENKRPVSSRPSLETVRTSNDDLEPVPRNLPKDARPRPSSAYLESHMEFLRDREQSQPKTNFLGKALPHAKTTDAPPPRTSPPEPAFLDEDPNIESNVEFLRQMEDQDSSSRGHKSRSSISGNKPKRASLPSMTLAGTKNLFAGKFGDAFKRFESNAATPPRSRSPSPDHDLDARFLTPIAGSEATDDRSDDGRPDDAALSGEQRREAERLRLAAEERRVAQAAAEYRQRVAHRDPSSATGPPPRSIGGVLRAATIQNKVKTLLDENARPEPARTAHGYGHFTDDDAAQQGEASSSSSSQQQRERERPGATQQQQQQQKQQPIAWRPVGSAAPAARGAGRTPRRNRCICTRGGVGRGGMRRRRRRGERRRCR